MKTLYVIAYRYREGLDEDKFRELTKRFQEIGTSPGILEHFERLDGAGGFMVRDVPEDPEQAFEVLLEYTPWVHFEVIPVTAFEDAFPVIQRVYG